MANCACGATWLIETCDLRTGRVRDILHPVSFEFQNVLNDVGQGSLTLPTKDVQVRNIWPHLTSIYITKIGEGAKFGGMVDSFEAGDDGTTSVGLKSIEDYLNKRTIRTDRVYTQIPQTVIARSLVQQVQQNGIPLYAEAAVSEFARDRTYFAYDRKVVGEAIEDMTQVLSGIDWERRHDRTDDGLWSTTLLFRDYVGENRNVIVQSDREASGYSLSVDAGDHATLVDAMGSGEEKNTLVYTAVDDSGIYPQFDASPAWKDVTIPSTLQAHGEGYLEDFREPFATPSITIVGTPPDIRLGDEITVNINYGAVTFNGPARVLNISTSVSNGGDPEQWTYELYPLGRASATVLNQMPRNDCKDCE